MHLIESSRREMGATGPWRNGRMGSSVLLDSFKYIKTHFSVVSDGRAEKQKSNG